MHDKLFTNQAAWSGLPDATDTFKKYAADIGLNASSFATCLSSHEMQEQINTDQSEGSAAGVNGTPGFWVIGEDGSQYISGAVPFATFKAAIDKLL